METKFASRKWILACAAFLMSSGLLIAGLLTPDLWVSFNAWLVGLYLAANVTQKAIAPPITNLKKDLPDGE